MARARKNLKTYVHVRQPGADGRNPRDRVVNGDQFETLLKLSAKGCERISTLTFSESEFGSWQQVLDYVKTADGTPVTEEAKLAWVNRGFTLAQQQAARTLVLADDPYFVNQAAPVDISSEAVIAGIKRKITPEAKAHRALVRLARENAPGFATVLAKLVAELPEDEQRRFRIGLRP